MKLPDNVRLTLAHDGATHVLRTGEALTAAGVPDAVILSAYKDYLAAAVDARAEVLRSGVITPGAGQALEYQEAQDQAAAALKAPSSATEAKYPMLAASIQIDMDPETGKPASDILGVARSIQAARDAWLTIGAAIRAARLKGKAAIAAATSPEEAAAAYAAIAWPSHAG